MRTVRHLFRHPIKALGTEALEETEVRAGETLPFDRIWAVAHEAARLQDGWNNCNNFIRGAKSASLMAITATSGTDGRLTLTHPDRPPLTLGPANDGDALLDWVRPLCNPTRALPARLVAATAQGMTDNARPYISLLNLASLRALEARAGRPLDPRRFRGNIWFDGGDPWEEFSWLSRRLTIGGLTFTVEERITRCVATHVDPDTGRPDSTLLRDLEEGWGHQDFGVFATAQDSGRVAVGTGVSLQ